MGTADAMGAIERANIDGRSALQRQRLKAAIGRFCERIPRDTQKFDTAGGKAERGVNLRPRG